jgi:hypothetical protein
MSMHAPLSHSVNVHNRLKDPVRRNLFLTGLILSALVMGVMVTACTPTNVPMENTPVPTPTLEPAATPGGQVEITGWFTTVWNGEAYYSITDEQGQTTQLLLEEAVAKPLGGPLALDRKRVTILGEVVNGSPRIVRVISVQFP